MEVYLVDQKVSKLVEMTKEKFGLANYYLKSYHLNRHVDLFRKTIYTLTTEWFPNEIEKLTEDLNPPGTALIEMDLHTAQYKRVIFVRGQTYAKNGLHFEKKDKQSIIDWIEKETGLSYEKQFQLQKEEVGRLVFREVFEGVQVFSSGLIEVNYNSEGDLTLFSLSGYYPSENLVQKETYTLSFEDTKHLFKEHLHLINFPIYEEEKLISVYGIEEVFIRNKEMSKISFEPLANTKSLTQVNRQLVYNKGSARPFVRKEINPFETVTAEEAFSFEPSLASYPITKDEEEKCLLGVKGFLAETYPEDSGLWTLKTLHRESNYIHAVLRLNKENNNLFQRKLTLIIDAENDHVINYVDNKSLLEMFNQFKAPEAASIDKEEAYENLKAFFKLDPHYVYDAQARTYVLCGKLDCSYGIDGSTGELLLLSDLN